MEEKKHSSDHIGKDTADKALWDLLGSARKVEPGPMFARNVMREVRNLDEEAFDWRKVFTWLSRPAFLVAAASVLVLAGIFVLQDQSGYVSVEPAPTDGVEYIDPAREFESIEMLGELMAVSDPGQLSDEALINLLF